MKSHHRLLVAASVAALSLSASAASAATRCVKPTPAPGCFTSIQAAVNASAAGDVVQVGAGTYFQIVVVPAGKDGMQIVGASKLTTILDPGPSSNAGTGGGDGITVSSRRVTIKNLMIRNGNNIGIHLAAPEPVVQGVNITGANLIGIAVNTGAWNAKLLQNEIHNTGTGIHTIAFGTLAQSNFITGSQLGVFLQAHGAQVIGNKIYNGGFGVAAIPGPSSGTVIKSNDIRHQTEAAVFLFGAFPTIQGNTVYGANAGIAVLCQTCYGGSVASNSVTDVAGAGILAGADAIGLVVQGNTLLRTGFGIIGSGNGVQVKLNKATDIGDDLFGHCFSVVGDDNMVAQNTATRCSQAGVYARGNRNYVDRNVISGTFENGVTVDGSGGPFSNTILIGNKVTGNAAHGVAIVGGAVDTFVTGNTGSGNRLDYCNDGTSTDFGPGNSFGTSASTGGTDCPIAHIQAP
jgi:hypothetical protein